MVLPFKNPFNPPFLHLTSLFVHASCQSPLTTRRGTKLPLGKTPAAASHGNSKPSVAGKIIAKESRWAVKGTTWSEKEGSFWTFRDPFLLMVWLLLGCQCPPFVTCQLMYEEACQGVSDINMKQFGSWSVNTFKRLGLFHPQKSFSSSKLQQVILLMVQKSRLHQLRLVSNPIIYKVLYISGGWPWDSSQQQYHFGKNKWCSSWVLHLVSFIQCMTFFSMSRLSDLSLAHWKPKEKVLTNSGSLCPKFMKFPQWVAPQILWKLHWRHEDMMKFIEVLWNLGRGFLHHDLQKSSTCGGFPS